ncbi:MAG TPA: YkvA family protein [Chthoniobacterales bacterium]|nr:YkvA family protein [Chthoniobacterales bacterium]
MKKAKAKSKPRIGKKPGQKEIERRVARPKAALRSEAFARALADAKAHANDPERLRVLFEEAARKAAAVPRDPFEDSWPYVQAMLRLVRAYFRGEYRNVSQEGLLWIVTALNYFVDPFDLIPDEVPFLGLVDDATVMTFTVARTRQTLDDFMTWEITAF